MGADGVRPISKIEILLKGIYDRLAGGVGGGGDVNLASSDITLPVSIAAEVAVGIADPIEVAGATVFVARQKTVAAAVTPEALGASTALKSGVIIQPLSTNTAAVEVRSTSGTAGFILAATASPVFVEIDDLDKVFIKVGVDGEGVSYYGS